MAPKQLSAFLALLALLPAAMGAADSPDNGFPRRHAMMTAGIPIAALFAREHDNPLAIRQDGYTCDIATETPCADGTGCCPEGAACTYADVNGNSYPACETPCAADAVVCSGGGCCSVGQECGSDGYCTIEGGGYTPTPLPTPVAPTGGVYTPPAGLTTPFFSPTPTPAPSPGGYGGGYGAASLSNALASISYSESLVDQSLAAIESAAAASESQFEASLGISTPTAAAGGSGVTGSGGAAAAAAGRVEISALAWIAVTIAVGAAAVGLW